jgi:hypothetical protein
MPRKSKERRQIDAHLKLLDEMIANPATPDYVRAKCIATAFRQRELDAKLKHEKAMAREAAKTSQPRLTYNVLPDNGRGPPAGWKPTPGAVIRDPG